MKSRKKAKLNVNKELWSKSEKRVLTGIGAFFIIALVISLVVAFAKDQAARDMLRSYENKEISHNLVCSSGNQIKFGSLMPLKIKDKTYWICCDQCKARLLYNVNTRYAVDPFSKNRINKADAIIIQNPKSNGMVLYFESMDNFLKYKESQKTM